MNRDSNEPLDRDLLENPTPQPIRKKRKRRNILLILLAAIFALILGTAATMYFSLSQSVKKMKTPDIPKEELAITPQVEKKISEYDNKVTNIMLIGIDSDMGKGEPQRSDAMMILTVDGKHKTLKLSSLMRDTYVPIKGHGTSKLNHAYAYGGAPLLLRTVNHSFDLDISEYARVDFTNLSNLIDEIGGIDLKLTKDEAKTVNDSLAHADATLKLEDGVQHVTGIQALAFSRIRKLDTDYKRTERQREVMSGIYNRLKSTSLLALPSVVEKLTPYVKTTLDEGQIIGLGTTILTNKMALAGRRFPLDDFSKISNKGDWHLIMDRDATIHQMHNFMYRNIDPMTGDVLKRMDVKSGD